MFHQHFNTSPHPARYLATAFGGLRYPFTASKKHTFEGVDVNVLKRGRVLRTLGLGLAVWLYVASAAQAATGYGPVGAETLWAIAQKINSEAHFLDLLGTVIDKH